MTAEHQDRMGCMPRDQLPPDQQKAYDTISAYIDGFFGDKFISRGEDGSLLGPLPFLATTPDAVEPYLNLLGALSKLKGIPPPARETLILAVGSVYKAGYELYAHENVAEKTGVLSRAQIESVMDGVKPGGQDRLDESCELAFDVAIQLSKGGGPLEDGLYERAMKTFGQEGTAALIHYVGMYAYTCIVINGVNASVPGKS